MCEWQIQDPMMKHLDIAAKKFIGEVDSQDEWSDGIHPEKFFVHTDSYKIICEKSTLFIFGRRGTGKTAVVQMLNYEIQSQKRKEYTYSRIINQEDAYHDLAIQVRNSPLANFPVEELVHTLKKKWLWAIEVSGMISILNEDTIPDIKKTAIIGYLKTLGFLKGKRKKYKVFSILAESLAGELEKIDNTPAKVGAALFRFGNKIFNKDFDSAQDELYNILEEEKKTCLVLIDSIERYNLKDKIAKSVIGGLIQALLEIYHDRKKGLYAKAAFPSEILRHMNPSNWGKTDDKLHIINWRYKDLIKLVAKRYYRFIINQNARINSINKYNDEKVALDFFYNYFPKTIEAKSGIEIDTMSYIISHTQKKPRQLIHLINAILTFAETENKEITNLDDETIINGTHILLDSLFKETIQIYQQIYPNAYDLVKRTLSEAEAYFDYKELDVKLKEINSLLKNNTEMIEITKEDVKNLLIESGILGIAREKHKLSNEKNILIALFEYQIKGTLTLNNASLCVIHPMFYQVFQIYSDMNTYVYPKPADEDEGLMLNKTIDMN